MAEVKNDAEKLDKILSHLDSASEKLDAFSKRMDTMESNYADGAKKLDAACARMDGFEKAKADAEEEDKKKADAARKDADEKEEKAKADKARKDAEEEEEKKKADAARADAARGDSSQKLQAQIDALSRRMAPDLAPDAKERLVGFQSKAERVAQAFGDSAGAPPFCSGESEHDYRVRLLSKYKAHSAPYKSADLSKIGDATVFDAIEDAIYADAMLAANNPTDIAPNVLIPRTRQDATGRKITKFIGTPGACWNRFKMPYRFVKRWGDEKTGQVVFN